MATTTGNEVVGSMGDLYKGLGLEAPETGNEVPAQEPQAEPQEPQVNPQEPVAGEPAPKEPGVKEPEPQEPQETFIETINKKLSTKFKDESEITNLLESANRIAELEDRLKELDSLKEQNLLLKENLDPMKYFESEDQFRATLFQRQFPDKNGTVAMQLFQTDLDTLSDKDAVAYKMMLDTPGLSKEKALAVIDREYDIDDEEMDDVAEARLKINGRQAIRDIKALKKEVNLPDKVDVESLAREQKDLHEKRLAELTKGWSTVTKEVAKSMPDLVVSDTDKDGKEWSFKYSLSQDFPEDVVNAVVNNMAGSGQEVSEGAVKSAHEVMKSFYYSRNIDKIIKAVREDVLAKAEEERLNKQHNPGSPRPDSQPEEKKGDDVQSRILSGLEGPARTNFLRR